jgi:bifunctional enzyme CysN/CysC
MKKENKGLIWLTGYSSAGKTTIANEIKKSLDRDGHKVIFLDGDDLRVILGTIGEYKKNERIDLAKIYFRLADHLVSQNYIVIISAIAMFDSISEWVKDNIFNSFQVLINVPAEIRLSRDQESKNIFKNGIMNDEIYDLPKKPDLIVDNYDIEINEVANKIISFFFENTDRTKPSIRSKYWNEVYASNNSPGYPSDFAKYVIEKINNNETLLEIGCGNGRDSVYFASKAAKVIGIDISGESINYCSTSFKNENLEFYSASLSQFFDRNKTITLDVIYSRFVFHAMTLKEELETIDKSRILLKKGGKLFIECRSLKDPLSLKGEHISETERIFGHYRRFVIAEELIKRLQNHDFEIIDFVEDNGLAVHVTEDPVVIRITAVKK